MENEYRDFRSDDFHRDAVEHGDVDWNGRKDGSGSTRTGTRALNKNPDDTAGIRTGTRVGKEGYT